MRHRTYYISSCRRAEVPLGYTLPSHTRVSVASKRFALRNISRRHHRAPPWQGPRHVRGRRPPADGRHRQDLRVRRGARLRRARQGPCAQPVVAVLVRAYHGHRGQPPDFDGSRRLSRSAAPARGPACRTLDAGAAHEAHSHRVRRPRIPVGLRLEGVPARRAGLRRPPPRRPARVRPPAGTNLHAGHQGGDRATTSTSEAEAARLVRFRIWWRDYGR